MCVVFFMFVYIVVMFVIVIVFVLCSLVKVVVNGDVFVLVVVKDMDIVVVIVIGVQQWIKDVLVSIIVIFCEEIECKLVFSIGQLLSMVFGVIGGYVLFGVQFKICLCGLFE